MKVENVMYGGWGYAFISTGKKKGCTFSQGW